VLVGQHGYGVAASATTLPKAQVLKAVGELQASAAASFDRGQNETRRLAADVRALKDTIDALKASGERVKPDPDIRALKASVEAVKDGIERAKQDQANRIAQLGAQVDPAAKLGQIVDKLDRIEKLAAAPKQAAAPPASGEPAATGSIADPKTATPKPLVSSWVVRDVYDGRALVEGREGLIEVGTGSTIPGIGRVEAIRREGKDWIVVTAKGVITSPRR
jgi:hypothetical protein